MKKTTLEVDEQLVEEASRVLGTKGLKATLDSALREAIAAEARRQVVDQLLTMEGLELDNPAVRRQAWLDSASPPHSLKTSIVSPPTPSS
jgi:Arc/MetJ family transcription regulator